MKITEIEACIDMRVNIGDFEGISNPLRLKATLEVGDDPQECIEELYKQASKAWAKQVLGKIRIYRKIREDNSKIYKVTGAAFDEAVRPAMRELKNMVTS